MARKQNAWIILEDGKPATYDHRLPVYWTKSVAIEESKEHCIKGKVVKCVLSFEAK